MNVDALLIPFGARWTDLKGAAVRAESIGFDGLWTWDHLSGRAYGQDRVLESWTVLSALASITEHVSLGPMVLNVHNRQPGVLGVMAATMQEVSSGRLMLGLGAGGGTRSEFSEEQRLLGMSVGPDPQRRQKVAEVVAQVRSVWKRTDGFLRPDPAPPIILGAHGLKMARLAGKIADGVDIEATDASAVTLAEIARKSSPNPSTFIVTTRSATPPTVTSGFMRDVERLQRLRPTRLILHIHPPYLDELRAAAPALQQLKEAL